MARLSIGRTVQAAFLTITLVLAATAGVGIIALYQARQTYEDRVAAADALELANANLLAASIDREAQRQPAPTLRNPNSVRSADAAYGAAARRAQSLARGDRRSEQLLRAQIAAETAGRLATARVYSRALAAREVARRDAARRAAASDSRTALLIVGASGIAALIAVLLLVSGLLRSMRRPLESLVGATERLASGDLHSRVEPEGPSEIATLARSFNRMGGDLERARTALEEERERLEVTIESLGDGLLVCDADGRIAATNPRAAELLPELQRGRALDDGDGPLPELAEALTREVTLEQDGLTLAVTAARMPRERGGVIWTVRDITERARLEQAKTDFVATASHELRSPLTSIKGYAELLGNSQRLDARERRFVHVIELSTNRLNDLVNDLLDVAKIDAQHIELHRRPTDLRELMEEVIELMAPRIAGKHQTLNLEVTDDLPLGDVDPGRVRQIVINLVTNAHLYTGEGDAITIHLSPHESELAIGVSDTGPGMAPDVVERIFDRFYRGEERRTETGTGLGLAIVKSLVELHDGSIEVISEVGVGTTFTIRLPQAPAPQAAGLDDALHGLHVLVVDDERPIAELIAEKLAGHGARASIALSGEEALARLREQTYDAVTLDVLMPGMSGIDLVQEIRADAKLRAIPVVFVSVFSGHGRLQGERVVAKPIDTAELRAVLAAAVAGGRTELLVVARGHLRRRLGPPLDDIGAGYAWTENQEQATRLSRERRFELALIDTGLPDPPGIARAIELRGRRDGPRWLFFSADESPAGEPSVTVLSVEDAVQAVCASLTGIAATGPAEAVGA